MTLDLHAYLGSLDEAGQAKLLGSKANLEAWRDYGADPQQMINAYRSGIHTAQDPRLGRIAWTAEGTAPRRGFGGWAMRNRATRLDIDAGMIQVAGRNRLVRRMPETILRTTQSREMVLRQLRLYGWVI